MLRLLMTLNILNIFINLFTTLRIQKFSISNVASKIETHVDNVKWRLHASRDYLSFNEIEEFAKYNNLTLKSEVKGPYLRLEAFANGNEEQETKVGYLTAFIRPFPFRLFQLDTIQVLNRRQTLGFKRKGWKVDGPGISFIMGTWALLFAKNSGCSETELLAVRDSDIMNLVLVRLYSSFGFIVKKEVKEDDVMDRLTWGAVGTLMSMNIDSFFKEWTPKTRVMLNEFRNK